MEAYTLLDQVHEDALHKTRLLNVEEKPFKRITKRLLTPNSLVATPSTLFPTPPPESTDEEAAAAQADAHKQKQLEEWRQFREDITLDFAAFESSIARIQFLLASNEKERKRYAAEKLRIQSTAQAVRDNTAELRKQLEEAQKTLALRKTYDDLADKITSNRLLRPREDQEANLQKLHAEIAQLEQESREYAQTWGERREQFGRIMEEGMNLRRLIRDEKEEVERREGMEEGEEGDEGDAGSKGRGSAVGTPKPDQDSVTPSHVGNEDSGPTSAPAQIEKHRPHVTGGATPLRQAMSAASTDGKAATQEPEDETMIDEGEVTGDESGPVGTVGSETRPDSRATAEPQDEKGPVEDRFGDKMDTS
ncbi:conserved hypothetical protein [Histoplasma capsulatum var. duboisii H88]|uniref:THO complex subunit, THOC7 superfamily domain-containing protein n=1 Tax=Ajellomyces capsulatus (strain H88) TaxID=544711 RepID=F0U939_AJEC8|nr:conserved hypothetical protein [Histoplasma capsulatum var. duboisii H88]QSS51750.1 THO complex subunit, THOC7 superfamily domain-containing protein [Histoplasma capsulatum var. duboisii H88]